MPTDRADRRAAPRPRRHRRPRPRPSRSARRAAWVDAGPRRRRAGVRRRRLGPDRQWSPRRARPARGLPRVPAERGRGDGLHPHRRPRRPRSTPSPTGCRSPWSPTARDGALAIDSSTGEEAPSRRCRSPRSTRPAPATCSAPRSSLGTLAGWPLATGWRFANLCAALAVQHFGGSLAAPGWGDIADWWSTSRPRPSTTRTAARCAAATPSSTTSSATCLPDWAPGHRHHRPARRRRGVPGGHPGGSGGSGRPAVGQRRLSASRMRCSRSADQSGGFVTATHARRFDSNEYMWP